MLTLHFFPTSSQLSPPLTSIHQSQFEDRRSRKGSRPRSNHLSQRKKSKKKKTTRHRWFFNAFGCHSRTQRLCFLGCGCGYNASSSIYHLWKAFDINSNVGGACGEIVALKGQYGLNLLVAAQNFEYKMSNILEINLCTS
jgi:hypothetical protein